MSGTGISERLRALGRQLATGGDYRIDAAAALIDDMVAVLEADAEACAACNGTGRVSRHIEGQDTQAAQDADEQPCEDCAEIRAVIAKAEGRS